MQSILSPSGVPPSAGALVWCDRGRFITATGDGSSLSHRMQSILSPSGVPLCGMGIGMEKTWHMAAIVWKAYNVGAANGCPVAA
jgi:hypothetical protein